MMEKMMRRMIALAVAMSLFGGMLAVPAAADATEGVDPAPTQSSATVTVEVTDSTGNVVGTKTTTTTTTDTGSTVTEKVETTTNTSEGGVDKETTESTSTTTDTATGEVLGSETGNQETITSSDTQKTEDGHITTTDTDSQWSETTTDNTPGETEQIDDNVTQRTDVTVTTETEGKQTNTDEVERNNEEGWTRYSGSEQGSESSETTFTTTTTTVTENDLLDSQIDTPEVAPTFKEGDYGQPQVHNGDWTRDPANDVTDTTWETLPGSETTTDMGTETEAVPEPLDGDDETVTLEMTPGGTDSKEKEVPLTTLIPKEGTQSDGSVVKHVYKTDAQGQIVKDKNGKPIVVGYTVTRYGAEMEALDNDENPIVPDENTTTAARLIESTEDVRILPPDFTEGTVTSSVQGRDGVTTIDTETVTTLLESGNGYKIVTTKVVTGNPDALLSDITGDSPEDFYNTPAIPDDAVWLDDDHKSYIRLPAKPQSSTATDPDGNTTAVTVEELTDDTGMVIGYKATTTVTDAKGNLKSQSSITEYGSITTFSTTVERDPDTKQVITVTEQIVTGLQDTETYTNTTRGTQDQDITRLGQQDIYQMVETEQGLVFIYNGIMYQVLDESSNEASQNVINDVTVNVDSFIDGTGEAAANDLRIDGQGHGQHFSGSDFEKTIGSQWTLSGYGLYTDFQVVETNGATHRPRHFELQREVNGQIETRYVYCVEMGTEILYGSNYGFAEYKDSGDSNVPWQGAEGTIGQLRSVALNGFWGTNEGLGSLQAVQDLMRRNGVAGWENLTPGMALAATQVAVWEFGANTSGQFGGYKEDGTRYTEPNGYEFISMDGNTNGIDDDKMKIVEDLRDLLVKLAYNPQEGKAEEIDGSDVVGGAITLKERISEDSNGVGTYNTDISFALDVSTSSLNGDLIVTVKVGGEDVGYARLAGNDKPGLLDGLLNWGRIYPAKDADGNYVYTIPNVELAEGVVVDLNLTGTQHLDDGIYVFESEDWQDFVGLSTLERNVDITVSMEFNVQEPELEMEQSRKEWTELRTDKDAYIRTNTLNYSRIGTQTDTDVTVTTNVYGTRTQTDVITTVSKVERDWESYYDYTETDSNDWEVEKADPPKTGDTTLILAMVSLLSGGAYILLNRKKEEEI